MIEREVMATATEKLVSVRLEYKGMHHHPASAECECVVRLTNTQAIVVEKRPITQLDDGGKVYMGGRPVRLCRKTGRTIPRLFGTPSWHVPASELAKLKQL